MVVTSDFQELKSTELDGSRVAVGFRPSGDLHVGNLLTIAYSAVIADRLGLDLEIACCDTDWSAHIHQNHIPEENRVMKLFFNRDCPCGEHDSIAEHRLDELKPFLDGLGIEYETMFLSELNDEAYVDSLRTVLENVDEFDQFFGGGFRRRYTSPVAPVCACGFSHAKGGSYSSADSVVAGCWNPDCGNGFMESSLDGEIGVYYLVDPVRDASRDVAVHVFGGDYRDAEKGQKTSKIEKVRKITELANSDTPAYFLAPVISDNEGRPLSKSRGNGKTLGDIEDPRSYASSLVSNIDDWIEDEKKYLPMSGL